MTRTTLRRLATVGAFVAAAELTMDGQGNADWPLHNRDLHNSRYAPHDQINTSNVDRLAVDWTFEMPAGGSIASTTPLVIDGVMYFNAGSTLHAVDAATGQMRWSVTTEPAFRGGGRGPVYGDGRIYAFGSSIIYAVDATTGLPVDSFGNGGRLSITSEALAFKYPDTYPPDVNPESLGYFMRTPPAYFDGVLYVGTLYSENLIRGGLLIAADGTTGAIRWVFNTVPQGPTDDGWELAKDTWGSGARLGGDLDAAGDRSRTRTPVCERVEPGD